MSGLQMTEDENCVDINECELDPQVCDQVCTNTFGSFKCSCKAGYTLVDKRSCKDINECTLFNHCPGYCENLSGSFNCDCPPGTILSSNRTQCEDVNECEKDICQPDEICLNEFGGYTCYKIVCPTEYSLQNK